MSFDPDTPVIAQDHDNCVVVSFLADTLLDFQVIGATDQALAKLIETRDPPNLVLSMPNVKQVSSMMISVLIKTAEATKANGGATRLANISKRVDSILDMAAIKPVFEIFETEEAARASFD